MQNSFVLKNQKQEKSVYTVSLTQKYFAITSWLRTNYVLARNVTSFPMQNQEFFLATKWYTEVFKNAWLPK